MILLIMMGVGPGTVAAGGLAIRHEKEELMLELTSDLAHYENP